MFGFHSVLHVNLHIDQYVLVFSNVKLLNIAEMAVVLRIDPVHHQWLV